MPSGRGPPYNGHGRANSATVADRTPISFVVPMAQKSSKNVHEDWRFVSTAATRARHCFASQKWHHRSQNSIVSRRNPSRQNERLGANASLHWARIPGSALEGNSQSAFSIGNYDHDGRTINIALCRSRVRPNHSRKYLFPALRQNRNIICLPSPRVLGEGLTHYFFRPERLLALVLILRCPNGMSGLVSSQVSAHCHLDRRLPKRKRWDPIILSVSIG
jgi:hypothetical protein